MHRIDTSDATVDNKFTEGNPSLGIAATSVSADIMNALQEEIVAVILEAGMPLVKANNGQLLAAIQSLIAGGGSAVSAAGVSIDDAGGFYTGATVEDALHQLAEKLYNGTLNSNQVRRQVLTLNGAAFSTGATHADNILVLSNPTAITYTLNLDVVWDAPIGTAIQIVQGGAGKVTVVAPGGVTMKKPAVFNAATLGQDATIVLYKTSPDEWRLGGMLEAA